MLIQSINNRYSYNLFRNSYSGTCNKNFPINNKLSGDVVSFTSKKYDADSIINPTNHCAYCGCKVYSEAQIQSIAKEILSSKADRLRGEVRSVLEKLSDAKNSQEIAIAKRIENEQQIKFFEGLLDISSKKSFLKGEAIFEQVYHLSKDDAIELLTQNMLPLQRTIDHVSPQNEQKANSNADINLVEACYCCNHDLKKGSSFNEFYTMFPSIKNNMPPEKFEYASAGLLDSSQSQISQRFSTTNILKLMKNLFAQRTEAANNLYAVDCRIKGYKTTIQDSIESCKGEIKEKEDEIIALQEKFDILNQDPEFVALLRRLSILSSMELTKTTASGIRDRIQKLSNAINEIRNQKQQKNVKQMGEDEKEEKINSLKKSMDALTPQLAALDEKYLELEIELDELNNQFPTLEMLQSKKTQVETIIDAYQAINGENIEIRSKTEKMSQLQQTVASLETQIGQLPDSATNFDILTYDEDSQEVFQRYKLILDALDFIEKHPNGGNVKALINSSAKKQITEELEALEQQAVVTDYINSEKRKDLVSQLEKVQKDISELKIGIDKLVQIRNKHKEITSAMSEEDAKLQLQTLSEQMRTLIEKQNYVKIPQTITTIKAEITLLRQTIKDLEAQITKIDEIYTVND